MSEEPRPCIKNNQLASSALELVGCPGERPSARRSGLLELFLQAEGGIRAYKVTGVQTCALPIYYAKLGFSRLPPERVKFPGPVDPKRIRFAKAAYRLREGVAPIPDLSLVAEENG